MCYICWEIGAFWLICYILAQNDEFKCQNFETSTLTENIRKMSSHSNNTHNREKCYFIRLYYSVFLGIEAQISTKFAKKRWKCQVSEFCTVLYKTYSKFVLVSTKPKSQLRSPNHEKLISKTTQIYFSYVFITYLRSLIT